MPSSFGEQRGSGPRGQNAGPPRPLTFSISLWVLRDHVLHGREVAFRQGENGPVFTGYPCGMDREYFVILVADEDEPFYHQEVVSRGLNSGFIPTGRVMEDEDKAAFQAMWETQAKFRDWVNKAKLVGQPDPTAQPPRTGQPADRDLPRPSSRTPDFSSPTKR